MTGPPAPDFVADLAALQARLDRSPFNAWLGIRLVAGGGGQSELHVPWQDTFISTPERRVTHGGVLASLVDVAAIYALICSSGRLYATVDLRVDYHAAARPGAFRALGTALHTGRRLASSEARILDSEGRLVASGRGAFSMLDLPA